jgi:hypothetical protein
MEISPSGSPFAIPSARGEDLKAIIVFLRRDVVSIPD